MEPEVSTIAQPQILEGTTEEITTLLRRGAFAGRKLRVIVDPQEELLQETRIEKSGNANQPKRPSALGKYAFVAGGSEAFAREKQAEIEHEDKPL